jgi:hypothetical protein
MAAPSLTTTRLSSCVPFTSTEAPRTESWIVESYSPLGRETWSSTWATWHYEESRHGAEGALIACDAHLHRALEVTQQQNALIKVAPDDAAP